MNEKATFIIKLSFVSVIVWLFTVLLFTDELLFNASEIESNSNNLEFSQIENGRYTGAAKGHNDLLTVEVIVSNGEVAQINIPLHSETQGISDPALDQVPAQIIKTNSLDVDTISGATFTSEAIINATNDALNQTN